MQDLTMTKYLSRMGLLRRNTSSPELVTGQSGLIVKDHKEVGAMNTTWNRQYLLGQFGRAAVILHHGLALVGLVAVLLVFARGKALFFDEQPSRSATIGAIHYDGGASLFDGAEEADGEKYRALAAYVS